MQKHGWHEACCTHWREAALSCPSRRSSRHRGGPMIAWFRCFVRNHHNPVRHPLGGFKCADCGEASADLEQMGFADGVLGAERPRLVDRALSSSKLQTPPSVYRLPPGVERAVAAADTSWSVGR